MTAKANSKQTGRIGRILRRIAAGLFFLGLIVATVLALLPKPVPIEVATIAAGPMRVTVDEDGKTRVIDRYLVSAPLGGTIGRHQHHPGDAVAEGELLATIEAIEPPLLDARTRAEAEARLKAAEAAKRQAQAGVNLAKTGYDFAVSERERIAKLVGKQSLAQRSLDVADLDVQTAKQELESARFGVRVAQYEVETAKAAVRRIDVHQQRSDAKAKPSASKPGVDKPDGGEQAGPVVEVHSPIAGTILRVIQEQEGVIVPGAPLFELADPNALEIVVDVLTSDAVHIRRGAEVVIRQWGGAEALAGRVRLVEPSAFTKISALGVEEQRVNVVIDLLAGPEAKELALGDGYRVEVSIVIWQADEILLLPISALFRDGDRWAVWVVADDRARLRPVTIGHRQGLVAEVVDGLQTGETVIVHPSDAIIDGVEVAGQ